MPSLAEMLGYIVQPLGGPAIPILPKAASNVTGGSIPGVPGPKGQPLSSPAEMMNALTAISAAQSEAKLKAAQAAELERLAKFRDKFPGLFDDALKAIAGGGGGAVATPAATPVFGSLGEPTINGNRVAGVPALDFGSPGEYGVGQRGGRRSFEQVAQLARDVGFSPDKAQIMAATVMGESGGDPFAYNPGTPQRRENSYGLTQINADAHGPKAKEALGNDRRALELAFEISKGGEDFTPWSVYKSGEYKKYLPSGQTDAPMSLAGSPAMSLPAVAPPVVTPAPGAGPNISPAALAIARLGGMAAVGKWGDVSGPLAQAFYNSPGQKAAVTTAEKTASWPFDTGKTQFEKDLAARNEAAQSRLNAELKAQGEGIRFDAAGRAVPVDQFNEVTAATAGAKAAAEEQAKAERDVVPVTVTLPDGTLQKRQMTRAELSARLAQSAGRAPLGAAPQTGQPTLLPGGAIIGGEPIGIGETPPGYQLTMPSGAPRLGVIPGGPAAEAEQAKATTRQTTANRMLRNIDDALELSKDWTTTGFAGARLKAVEGTQAHNLAATIDSIEARLAFGELQQMRDGSKTGGALGAVAVPELDLLKASVESIRQSQTRTQFERNVKRLRSEYQDVVDGFAGAEKLTPAERVEEIRKRHSDNEQPTITTPYGTIRQVR
jgi:hypothetical protein